MNGDEDISLILLYESKLSTLKKIKIMKLLLIKSVYIKETTLAEVVKTFIFEIERRDRILNSILRTITRSEEKGEKGDGFF